MKENKIYMEALKKVLRGCLVRWKKILSSFLVLFIPLVSLVSVIYWLSKYLNAQNVTLGMGIINFLFGRLRIQDNVFLIGVFVVGIYILFEIFNMGVEFIKKVRKLK